MLQTIIAAVDTIVYPTTLQTVPHTHAMLITALTAVDILATDITHTTQEIRLVETVRVTTALAITPLTVLVRTAHPIMELTAAMQYVLTTVLAITVHHTMQTLQIMDTLMQTQLVMLDHTTTARHATQATSVCSSRRLTL